MSSCATCGTTIVFGGEQRSGRTYCNEKCLQEDRVGQVAAGFSEADVMRAATAIVNGVCPQCGRHGSPVGAWVSHRAMSFLVMTRWSSHPALCCAPCGRKAAILNTLLTFTLGWWGFPWGLIATPVQILRNVFSLMPWVDHADPRSPTMLEFAARQMAVAGLEAAQARQLTQGSPARAARP